MALHSLYCADVPLRNCSLTHSLLSCSSDNCHCAGTTKVAVKVMGRNAWRGKHWGDLGKQTWKVQSWCFGQIVPNTGSRSVLCLVD